MTRYSSRFLLVVYETFKDSCLFCFVFSCCSLDTFPYAGTTTTCESLYMGVPCVTMAGSVHAHNVGVSLLTNVGE